jgi:transcriptional repressor NrdR
LESQVKDSRPSEDGGAIRRRRFCSDCGGRFTTFERVQLRELTVVKRSGRRTPFEREKLVMSISLAMRKRPIDPERVERMVSGIVRQLESRGETELPSTVVGELVMKSLKALDEVAYVRYASVYRDFRETEDFARFLGDEGLNDDPALDDGHGPQALLDGHGQGKLGQGKSGEGKSGEGKLNAVAPGHADLDERIKI